MPVWLPIVICVGAVALLLGPIMLMQPTQAQRREAALRQAASQAGLRVHLQSPPTGADVPARLQVAGMYCLPWKTQADARSVWLLIKKKYTHELHAFGHWDWSSEQKVDRLGGLGLCLESVPAEVFAIASGPQGLCCYWSERGPVERVEVLASWLKDTAAVIGIGAS